MVLRKFIYTVSLTFTFFFRYTNLVIGATSNVAAQEVNLVKAVKSDFDKAVELIKKYEGLHKNHGDLIGYGHKIVAGEPYKRNQNLTEAQAEALLRKDLAALCEKYRSFGKDSLLLSALAYNCGTGMVARSSVFKNLQAGNRNIKAAYLSYSKANGKTLSQLKRRRTEEYETLFIPD